MYVYDLRASNPKEYNRVKRRFYYHLGRLFPSRKLWRTESCIVVPAKQERILENLFMGFGSNITVYKTAIRRLQLLKTHSSKPKAVHPTA